MFFDIFAGELIPIGHRLNRNGSPVPSGSCRVSVRNAAGLVLNWSTGVFGTYAAVGASRFLAMTEIDAANDAGRYAIALGTPWDTTGYAAGVYSYLVEEVTPNAGNRAVVNVRVGAFSLFAAASALATAKTAIDAANTTLAAIQGGSWSGTTDSLHALRTALDAAQADLTAIKGASFAGGTDDLHSLHALVAGKASQTSVDTANTGITAIMGAGFVGGTDDLHSAHALLAATAKPGDAMALVTAAIAATSFASAAITAAAFATNSITANAVAADAVSEIQAGLALDANVAKPGDLMGLANNAITSAKIATNAITANGLASDAVTEIQFGLALGSDVTAATTAINANTDTKAAAIPAAVNTALGTAHGSGSWATATNYATPTNVTDAVTAVNANTATVSGGAVTDILDYARKLAPYAADGDVVGVGITTTSVPTNIDAPDGFFDERTLICTDGTGARSSATISSYTALTRTFVLRTPLQFLPDGNCKVFISEMLAEATEIAQRQAQNFLDGIDGNTATILGALGAYNTFTVASASTTVIHTDCPDPDNTWKDKCLVVGIGAPRTFGSRVVSQIGGVFTVSPPLPTVPDPTDQITLLTIPIGATLAEVVAAAAAVIVAPGGIDTASLASGALTAIASSVWATPTSLAAIDTYGWAAALMPEWILGKQTLTPGAPGKLRFFNRAGALLFTYDMTDKDDAAVVAGTGAPVNRSAAT